MYLGMNERTPFIWVSNLMRKIKDRQDDLTRRKIQVLECKAYDYYLTIYIADMLINRRVDFHPELYLCGLVECYPARRNAILAVQEIVNQGKKRIDECYSILLKNIREYREQQKKQRIS